MAVERRGPFWDRVEGRVPAPPAARLLGWKLVRIEEGALSTADGTLVAIATATARLIPFQMLRSPA